MTIKASGPISASEVQAEIGTAGTANARFSFLRDYGLPSFKNIGGAYSKAWYQSNNQGNCNVDSAGAATSSGNIQCHTRLIQNTTRYYASYPRSWKKTQTNSTGLATISLHLLSEFFRLY
jgi:hypothetical protein